jgi:metal-responsive CopG/Arc/MetJ family transcriptional regulator
MKKAISVSLSNDVLEKLDNYCKEEGKIKSFVIEKAISEYFENLKNRARKIESALEIYKDFSNPQKN